MLMDACWHLHRARAAAARCGRGPGSRRTGRGTGAVGVDVVGSDLTIRQLPDDVVVTCRCRVNDGVAQG